MEMKNIYDLIVKYFNNKNYLAVDTSSKDKNIIMIFYRKRGQWGKNWCINIQIDYENNIIKIYTKLYNFNKEKEDSIYSSLNELNIKNCFLKFFVNKDPEKIVMAYVDFLLVNNRESLVNLLDYYFSEFIEKLDSLDIPDDNTEGRGYFYGRSRRGYNRRF